MNTKIQELTDKIYREGVEKGNEEAGRIIAEAQSQKQSMISEAEAEAKRVIAEAEKQASELKYLVPVHHHYLNGYNVVHQIARGKNLLLSDDNVDCRIRGYSFHEEHKTVQ